MFKTHVEAKHPGIYLWPLDHVNGARQDFCVAGAKGAYYNRAMWVEFLIYLLSCEDSDNMLQERLFVLLSSVEMTAVSRSMAIVAICISEPLR